MADAYDPHEEEGRRPSQYISKKDWRIIGIVLVVVLVVGYPAYRWLLRWTHTATCSNNFRKISGAILQYASSNDEHLPFAYEVAGMNGEINLHQGHALTWHWALLSYVGDWSVFQCPEASPSENTLTSDGQTVQPVSYGMLNAYSNVIVSTIASPGSKFLISETSKNGAGDSYDPRPPLAGGVALKDDGFKIGFDSYTAGSDEDYPNSGTSFATRLAFPSSKAGPFGPDTGTRHPGGIHFLTVDGNLLFRGPEAAKVIPLAGSYGSWDVPKPPIRTGTPSLRP